MSWDEDDSDALRRSRLIAQAEFVGRQISHGDLEGACETLHAMLAEDPDDAWAHATLALCLVDRKLLGPAEAEATAALLADAGEPRAHSAMGWVLLAQRKLDAAAECLERARDLDPDEPLCYLHLAQLEALRGRPRVALLERALEVDAENADALAALAEERLENNAIEQAHEFARRALESDPECHDALIAMGGVLLRRGALDEAREHAAMALRQDATSSHAIHLLVSIKARNNVFLGAWFRWNLWMGGLGDNRSTAVLIGGYIVQSLLAAIAEDLDRHDIALIVSYVWLGLVAYSWIAPGVFTALLAKEIRSVTLRDDF